MWAGFPNFRIDSFFVLYKHILPEKGVIEFQIPRISTSCNQWLFCIYTLLSVCEQIPTGITKEECTCTAPFKSTSYSKCYNKKQIIRHACCLMNLTGLENQILCKTLHSASIRVPSRCPPSLWLRPPAQVLQPFIEPCLSCKGKGETSDLTLSVISRIPAFLLQFVMKLIRNQGTWMCLNFPSPTTCLHALR